MRCFNTAHALMVNQLTHYSLLHILERGYKFILYMLLFFLGFVGGSLVAKGQPTFITEITVSPKDLSPAQYAIYQQLLTQNTLAPPSNLLNWQTLPMPSKTDGSV